MHVAVRLTDVQLQVFGERLAVAQPGEGVAVGHVQQLFLVGHLLGDVVQDAAETDDLARTAVHHRKMRFAVAEAAIQAAHHRAQHVGSLRLRGGQQAAQLEHVIRVGEQVEQRMARHHAIAKAEQLAQGAVAAAQAACLVDLEIAVADAVQDRPSPVLALRQALQHVVQVVGELADLVVAQGGELRLRGFRADAVHFMVQAMYATQNPAIQPNVHQHDGDGRHASGQ
ncbi:hypothetical protein D9M71_178430 [compost metagenome]